MGWAYARPRVIRGTRPSHYRCFLPDLAGFAAGALHGARDLTSNHRIMAAPRSEETGKTGRAAKGGARPSGARTPGRCRPGFRTLLRCAARSVLRARLRSAPPRATMRQPAAP